MNEGMDESLNNKWTKQRIVNSSTCSCIEQTNCILLSVVTYFTIEQMKQYKDSYIDELQKNNTIIIRLQYTKQSECTCECMYMYVYRVVVSSLLV